MLVLSLSSFFYCIDYIPESGILFFFSSMRNYAWCVSVIDSTVHHADLLDLATTLYNAIMDYLASDLSWLVR